jgi:hypothetical protein
MEQPNKIFVALRFLMWGTAALLLALPAIAMRACHSHCQAITVWPSRVM